MDFAGRLKIRTGSDLSPLISNESALSKFCSRNGFPIMQHSICRQTFGSKSFHCLNHDQTIIVVFIPNINLSKILNFVSIYRKSLITDELEQVSLPRIRPSVSLTGLRDIAIFIDTQCIGSSLYIELNPSKHSQISVVTFKYSNQSCDMDILKHINQPVSPEMIEQFVEDSFINIPNLLSRDDLAALCEKLYHGSKMSSNIAGPFDYRKYRLIDTHALRGFERIFKTKSFAQYLEKLSGHVVLGLSSYELRHISNGDFQILNEKYSQKLHGGAIDVIFTIIPELLDQNLDFEITNGENSNLIDQFFLWHTDAASIVYLMPTQDDEENARASDCEVENQEVALLVTPVSNQLTVVYRSNEAAIQLYMGNAVAPVKINFFQLVATFKVQISPNDEGIC